jgi:MFS family permease
MTNSRLTDPEVLEWRFPVRLESFRIRRRSGGAGRHRGGDGVERRLRFLEPMTAVMLANHRRIAPFGVAGGAPGATGRNWIERAGGARDEFSATFATDVARDDVIVIETPWRRRIRRSMSENPAIPRLAFASVAGTSLEYYDFAVYNTLAALVFNQIFFPSFDPMTGTILSFATFGVGYASRPFGGLLFGHLGDRYGRRFVLVMTLIMMGITTVLIGLLPTYAQIGAWAPVLLVSLRFLQGMALGGEWAGAVLLSLEHGEQRQHGRNGSFAQMGPSIGTLIAAGVIALTSKFVGDEKTPGLGLARAAARERGLGHLRAVAAPRRHRDAAVSRARATWRKVPRAAVAGTAPPLARPDHRRWRAHGPGRAVLAGRRFHATYITSILGLSRTLAVTALTIGAACNAV